MRKSGPAKTGPAVLVATALTSVNHDIMSLQNQVVMILMVTDQAV